MTDGHSRNLAFRDEAHVIADIEQLRRGFHADGNWSLAQSCWHLQTAIAGCLRPPADTTLTADNVKYQRMLDGMLAAGSMPCGLPAPEGTTPPDRVDDSAVDEFVEGLKKLEAYSDTHADFSVFGPVPIEKFRQFILIHSAHHLGLLRPTA